MPEAQSESTRALLRDRRVSRLLAVSFLSTGATFLQAAALGKQVYDITGSNLDLGLLGLVEFVPSAALVLVTGSIVFASIPIYASMKAVDRRLFEAARDLGASWFQIFRKILLPLVAPGVFISIALVFIPFFTEFATPGLVGGRSGYMIGNTIAEQISATGEFGGGTAMSLVLLAAAGVFSLIAYSVTRMKSLGTAA